MNVVHQIQQAGILLAEDGFVAVRKKIPVTPVAAVQARRVGGEQAFHDNRYRRIPGPQQQAAAVIIVGSIPGASCPAEDALLATQNILLAAHALGLGTCLIGFAVSAMQKDGRIKDLLKIPRAENVHAVIAVGHPAVAYQRLAGRKKAVSRFVEP